MAFKSYLAASEGGAFRLSSPQPLVFSGQHGLIARHVRSDPVRAVDPWLLTPDDLHRLSGLPAGENRWIVFEQNEQGRLLLSRLEKITGLSAEKTELLLTLAPLTLARRDLHLLVQAPPAGRAWTEELALDGSTHNPDGNWRWCNRPLNIGAIVLGGAASR